MDADTSGGLGVSELEAVAVLSSGEDRVAIRSGVKVSPDWDNATVFTEGTRCVGKDLEVEGASCL